VHVEGRGGHLLDTGQRQLVILEFCRVCADIFDLIHLLNPKASQLLLLLLLLLVVVEGYLRRLRILRLNLPIRRHPWLHLRPRKQITSANQTHRTHPITSPSTPNGMHVERRGFTGALPRIKLNNPKPSGYRVPEQTRACLTPTKTAE
jgi:hypothetical protein